MRYGPRGGSALEYYNDPFDFSVSVTLLFRERPTTYLSTTYYLPPTTHYLLPTSHIPTSIHIPLSNPQAASA